MTTTTPRPVPATDRVPARPASLLLGTLTGTDIYLAIVVADRVVAHLCDGRDLVAYLEGDRSDTTIEAREPSGIALTADVEDDQATGTVLLAGGRRYPFTAKAARGSAGYFFRAARRGPRVTLGGWIRLADGTVRGSVIDVSTTGDEDKDDRGALLVDGGEGPVPADAQPLIFGSLGGALRCGIAGFKYRKVRDQYYNGTATFDEWIAGRDNMREACGISGGSATTSSVHVGAVADTDAFVAVASQPDGVFAYVCDGRREVAYLSGTRSGARLAASEPAGLISLDGRLDGETVSGTVTTSDGKAHRFVAEPATGDAGLFGTGARDARNITMGGYIRLEDGSVRGAVATLPLTRGDTTEPRHGRIEGGGSVPSDAQPFGFFANVRCGIASFKFYRAKDRHQQQGTAGSQAALDKAEGAAQEACNPTPGGATT